MYAAASTSSTQGAWIERVDVCIIVGQWVSGKLRPFSGRRSAFYTYIGWPQPLWWYGTHHRDSEFWIQAVRDVAADPADSLFEAALAELMRKNGSELLGAIRALPEEAPDRVFDILLNFTVETESYVKEIWSLVLERGHERDLDIWAEKVCGVAEAFKDLWVICDTFGRTDLTNKVIASIGGDYEAFRLVTDLANLDEVFEQIARDKDNGSREVQEKIRMTIADQLFAQCLAAEPRLYGTWDLIVGRLKGLNASPQTMEKAAAERLKAVDRHFAVEGSRSYFPPEPELLGWRDFRTTCFEPDESGKVGTAMAPPQ